MVANYRCILRFKKMGPIALKLLFARIGSDQAENSTNPSDERIFLNAELALRNSV